MPINQMSTLAGANSFRRSGSLIAGASFVAAGVAFCVNLLMARTLGPQSRGEVAFLLQISYFIAPLVTLGRERLILRGTGSNSPTATGGYAVAMAILFSVLLTPALGAMGFVVGAISLCGAMLSIFRANAVSQSQPRPYLTLFGLQQGLLLVGAGLLASFNVKDWRIWAACYSATTAIYVFTEIRSFLRRERVSASVASIALMPGVLAALTVTRLDRLLLPVLSGSYQLGLYVTVATATEPVFWVSQLLADRRSATSRRRSVHAYREATLFAVASACIGAALWFLLVPLFGPAFAEAKELIIPLTVAGFALAMFRQAIGRLLSSPSPASSTRAEVYTAVAAATIYSVAIPMYGAIGAAYASVVVYVFGFVISRLLIQKQG